MKAFQHLTVSILAAATALAAAGCGHVVTGAPLAARSTGATIMANGHSYKLGFNLKMAAVQQQNAHPQHLVRQGTIPTSADNRANCAPVYDQGQLGSCTAFSIAKGTREYLQRTEGETATPLSALAFYYDERKADGDIEGDNGSTLSTGLNVLHDTGVAPESDWAYDISKFEIAPPAAANKDAGAWKAKSITQLADLDDVKTAIAAGKPVSFGFTVYQSFEKIGSNGVMPMPKKSESVLGGHAVMAVGYDDAKKVLIVRNSWSATWGDKGYFYMPYAYASNADLVSDCWTAE